jgi:hypothetical protein
VPVSRPSLGVITRVERALLFTLRTFLRAEPLLVPSPTLSFRSMLARRVPGICTLLNGAHAAKKPWLTEDMRPRRRRHS